MACCRGVLHTCSPSNSWPSTARFCCDPGPPASWVRRPGRGSVADRGRAEQERLRSPAGDRRGPRLRRPAPVGPATKRSGRGAGHGGNARSCSVLPSRAESCLHAGSFPSCGTAGEIPGRLTPSIGQWSRRTWAVRQHADLSHGAHFGTPRATSSAGTVDFYATVSANANLLGPERLVVRLGSRGVLYVWNVEPRRAAAATPQPPVSPAEPIAQPAGPYRELIRTAPECEAPEHRGRGPASAVSGRLVTGNLAPASGLRRQR